MKKVILMFGVVALVFSCGTETAEVAPVEVVDSTAVGVVDSVDTVVVDSTVVDVDTTEVGE